jgi:hypothetical protein
MTGDVEPPRDCPFTLNADYNKEIQISCSAINILNTDSYLLVSRKFYSTLSDELMDFIF